MEADAPFFSLPELVEGEKKRGWSGQRDGREAEGEAGGSPKYAKKANIKAIKS